MKIDFKISKLMNNFAIQFQVFARMAELVDALVSNTNVFGRAGSTPAPGTKPCFLLIS